MILYIDTTNLENALIRLVQNDGRSIEEKEFASGRELNKRLLPEIESLLRERGFDKTDLTGIVVVLGPGSFTAVRIGVAVANALAFALKIPVNQEQNRWVEPIYGAPPKITISDSLRNELVLE